ncbi:MAG: adenylyl-sulfate kinase [Actinobacteria bacterium]|nr:adenylyl-sulfate kinase [Actinomycetota bacterium]
MSGITIWITGLSASGKTTIAAEAARQLDAMGTTPFILDGDALRTGLNADLGFSRADRQENVRRVGEVALLLADAGQVVLVPLISPYRADRDRVRTRHAEHGVRFVEVYLDVPIEVCEGRDPKGLYARARAGQLEHFTGVDDPYEPPLHAELSITPGATAADDAARLVAHVRAEIPR